MIISEHAERARAFQKGNPSQKFIDIAIDDVFTAEAVLHAKDASIAELTADVARYKADAERLDWCEANTEHGSMPYYEDGKFNVTWLSRRAEGVCTSQFNTLREAIDFAHNALKERV